MKQFQDLFRRILSEGVRRSNRTGVDTISVVGAHLTFDLREGFPAHTVKKLAFKSAVGEMLGFFRGYTNAADFRSINCKVWDANANKTPSWLASPYRQGEDDLGKIYSKQWTAWDDVRFEELARAKELMAQGFNPVAANSRRWVMHREINQLEECLRLLLTDPDSRRIMLTGWRPDQFDQMALPPCHVSYQLCADTTTNELDLVVYQRSQDLALSFNTAIDALYLETFARLSGFTPRIVHHFIADAHIYVNHLEGVQEMLRREPLPPPTLVISDQVRKVSVDEIPGVFARIQPEDYRLEGYQHHPHIPLEMAA
jgi:thymidylate synthase